MAFGPYFAALPVDAGGKRYVSEAAWDAVIDNFVNWKGNVNGGGYTLSNTVLAPASITGSPAATLGAVSATALSVGGTAIGTLIQNAVQTWAANVNANNRTLTGLTSLATNNGIELLPLGNVRLGVFNAMVSAGTFAINVEYTDQWRYIHNNACGGWLGQNYDNSGFAIWIAPKNTGGAGAPAPLVPRYFFDANGLLRLENAYDGGHVLLGSHHLWVDGSGRLRIKSSAPTSDTDGTIVGTQS